MTNHLGELDKYQQPLPDSMEGRPDRMERDAELCAAKKRIIRMMTGCEHILNIGPAMGWETLELLNTRGVSKVTCVTPFNEEATAIAEHTKGKNVDIVIGDMHYLETDWKGRFNGVFMSHVLEHSISPYAALCECCRVLVNGGIAVIVMPNASGYSGLENAKPRRLGSIGTHLFLPSIESLIEMARHVHYHCSDGGLRFSSYTEVPQTCGGRVHYVNRVWVFEKVPNSFYLEKERW